jgi:hypothetical protein
VEERERWLDNKIHSDIKYESGQETTKWKRRKTNRKKGKCQMECMMGVVFESK